ncbi:MAG: hypothetical protein ACXACI_05535 [Candidatus Hodarchaeales archaeon]|jgi:WD40 repeat protein
MGAAQATTSSTAITNLWVFTAEGLLITHFSNEEIDEESADPDMMAGLLLALTDLAGQLRGSSIQGVILDDRQLYYKQEEDLFAVGETPLNFSRSKELADGLLFVLSRFGQTSRDTPGFLKLDDFTATRSEIESFLVFNGFLEKDITFNPFANEEIIDNVGLITSQFLSKDGILVTGSADRFLKIWNLSKKKEGVFFVEGHSATIKAITSFENQIISFSETGEVFVWDSNTWQMMDKFSINCEVHKVFMDPRNANRLIILEPDGIALLLLDSRTLIPAEFDEELPSIVYSDFIFEGEQIITVHSDGSTIFYEPQSLEIKETGKIKLAPDDEIRSATLISRESGIVVATSKGNLIEYDLNRKTTDRMPYSLESGNVTFSAYEAQLDALILGFEHGSAIIILPFSKGSEAFRLEFDAHSDPVAFAGYLVRPDICVTCSTNRDIRIWRDFQLKDSVAILKAGKDKVENIYKNLKDIAAWLEISKAVETEAEAKKVIMRTRLYRSRVKSYYKVLNLEQPWWLKLALKREIGEGMSLLTEVDGQLKTFEDDVMPKVSQLISEEEEEEEEKFDLNSLKLR